VPFIAQHIHAPTLDNMPSVGANLLKYWGPLEFRISLTLRMPAISEQRRQNLSLHFIFEYEPVYCTMHMQVEQVVK